MDMKSIFIDTSALYALMVRDDPSHESAVEQLGHLESERATLVTSSFVLQETISLLQARTGMKTVRLFHQSLVPLLEVIWIDDGLYQRAMSALLAADARKISLTDWTSFEAMRDGGIGRAFAFDAHFGGQGFELLPGR